MQLNNDKNKKIKELSGQCTRRHHKNCFEHYNFFTNIEDKGNKGALVSALVFDKLKFRMMQLVNICNLHQDLDWTGMALGQSARIQH